MEEGRKYALANQSVYQRRFGFQRRSRGSACVLSVLAILFGANLVPRCGGYSVLTHEAIVDAAWNDGIRPVLLQRFPNATPEELQQAHAYAYGGAIIQDMGYYPFGSRFFSDLTHYVRSGDFVLALIAESQNLNEYAFALGALSHYAADTEGHPLATNLSVALMYPKLAKKYGPVVTYDQKPSAHAQVEFGFDVDQVAEGNYAPHAYHDFIGFEVSKPVLERAFARTYCVNLSSVFVSVDLVIGSYRHAVSSVIPRTTKVAWHMKRHEIQNSHPSEIRSEFIYNVSHSEYRTDWGTVYEKPGISARMKALFWRLVPKVGPFSTMAFHPPTPTVEQMYMHSFNETLEHYRGMLIAQQEGRLELPNENLDTGELTEPTVYPFSDEAYAKLLAKVNGEPVSDALRTDILVYYVDLGAPFATKKDPKAWQNVLDELTKLKGLPATGASQ
jgi:zinc dependent phospholipase C